MRWVSIERRAARRIRSASLRPSVLGLTSSVVALPRTVRAAADGIDRVGFAVGVAGLPLGRPGLANGEAFPLKQARQPCPVGAGPLDRDDPTETKAGSIPESQPKSHSETGRGGHFRRPERGERPPNGRPFLEEFGLTRLVDVGPVFDAVDVQNVLFDIEGEQHPVVTTPCGAQTEQFVGQGLAQPIGILGKCTGDEFDDRGGRLLGQPSETLQCRAGDLNLPRRVARWIPRRSPRRQPEFAAEVIAAGRVAFGYVAPGLVQVFADARL